MTSKARPLIGTYRIQCHGQFTFKDVEGIVPYLAKLGISHVYLSPILQSTLGSQHGYDVVDPTQVNREFGGIEGFRNLAATCHRFGLGIVVDIVPNHMATDVDNWWWQDVLAAGQQSPYSSYFDIYWKETGLTDQANRDGDKAKLPDSGELVSVDTSDRVLLAVLGQPYGLALAGGELELVSQDGYLKVGYFDHLFPMNLESIARVVDQVVEGLAGYENIGPLKDFQATLKSLVNRRPTDQAGRHQSFQERTQALANLARLSTEDQHAQQSLEKVLKTINSDSKKLHATIESQNYRLAYWRTGADELNYRRFFDVTSLVGLRTEVTEVFQAVHETTFQLVNEGCIDGLRVDHPDGLANPREYFSRLRERLPNTWIVAEKILEGDEEIPQSWRVAGTTGYDLMAQVNQVLTNPAGRIPLTKLYSELTNTSDTYEGLLRINKVRVIEELLFSDLWKLTNLIGTIAATDLRYRDFSRRSIQAALAALIAEIPVYRTYIEPTKQDKERSSATGQNASLDNTGADNTAAAGGLVPDSDRVMINTAVDAAKAGDPSIDEQVLDFLRLLITGQLEESVETGELIVETITRFQQLSGPVMAKGAEDTTFYQYHRLISLNEVGGDPGHFGLDLPTFHKTMTKRAKDWPMAMSGSSTHDTKRSEDVRFRIASIADRPEEWESLQGQWVEIGREFKENDYPEPATEYLIHQTIFGVPRVTEERLAAYLTKAMREAKKETSWLAPNGTYEANVINYARQFINSEKLEESGSSELVQEWHQLGYEKALAAKVLTLTLPGVPDVYQGTELWDDSLVDPDNRRQVDYTKRTKYLQELDEVQSPDWPVSDDRLKLWWTKTILELRRRFSSAFAGGYLGLLESGPYLAFLRGEEVIVLVKRWELSKEEDDSTRSDWLVLPETLTRVDWMDIRSGKQYSSKELGTAAIMDSSSVAILTRI